MRLSVATHHYRLQSVVVYSFPMERAFAISEFKAKRLRLLENVEKTKESLVITKHGRPLVRISAVNQPVSLENSWKKKAETCGDVVAFDVSTDWEANR